MKINTRKAEKESSVQGVCKNQQLLAVLYCVLFLIFLIFPLSIIQKGQVKSFY